VERAGRAKITSPAGPPARRQPLNHWHAQPLQNSS
jgi:hypothetical protein